MSMTSCCESCINKNDCDDSSLLNGGYNQGRIIEDCGDYEAGCTIITSLCPDCYTPLQHLDDVYGCPVCNREVTRSQEVRIIKKDGKLSIEKGDEQ